MEIKNGQDKYMLGDSLKTACILSFEHSKILDVS